MSLTIRPFVVWFGAAITFVLCTGTGYGLLDFPLWPSVVVGLLFSVTTAAAILLAFAWGARESSAFRTLWTPTRNAAYLIVMGVFQILLGILCGLTLDQPTSTVTLIAGVGGGTVLLVIAVIEYLRLRNRRGEGAGTTGPR